MNISVEGKVGKGWTCIDRCAFAMCVFVVCVYVFEGPWVWVFGAKSNLC